MSVTLLVPKNKNNNYLLEVSSESIYEIPCIKCFAIKDYYCDGLDTSNHHSYPALAIDKCELKEVLITSRTKETKYIKAITIPKNSFNDNFFFTLSKVS